MTEQRPTDDREWETIAAKSRERFDQVLDVAEDALHAGLLDASLVLLQSAAQLAWTSHAGFYRSARAEDLLRQVAAAGQATRGRQMPGSVPSPGRGVVHVATRVYATGGHTRLLQEWLQQSGSATDSVILTQQDGRAIPPAFVDAVRRSGASLVDLSARKRSLRSRSDALRQLCTDADLVILHTHPHDVTPSVALQASSAPVGLVNHADHVFWLGADVATGLLHLRDAGAVLARRSRAVPESRSRVLPLPLRDAGPVDRGLRDRARADLGLGDDDVLALTVASEYKFRGSGTDLGRYQHLHTRALERQANLRHVVAGPSQDDPEWRSVHERLRAIGIVPDTSSLLAAADLYLDSFPMGSLTSLLEAARSGIPTVARIADGPPLPLSADDPALADHEVFFRDDEGYLARIDALVSDPAERTSSGEALRRSVLHLHTGGGWVAELEACVEWLRGTAGQPLPEAPALGQLQLGANDRLLIGMQRAGRESTPEGVLAKNLGFAPPRQRTWSWSRLRSAGLQVPLRGLVSERTASHARRAQPVLRSLRRPRVRGRR